MSGWARRGFSTALRWSAVGTAGVAGIAGAQAWALHARYDPLPDARGPTRGVASPKIDGGRSRAETSPAGEALMKARDEAREFFELKVRPRLERLEGQTARLSSKDDPSSVSAATTSMMQRMIKNKNDSSSGLTRTLRRTRRVVIVGDSLVTGVGCRVDRCDGPMLPRRLGEVLAELIGADVEWVAVGAKVRVSFYFRTVRAISILTSCLCIQLNRARTSPPSAATLSRRSNAAQRVTTVHLLLHMNTIQIQPTHTNPSTRWCSCAASTTSSTRSAAAQLCHFTPI